MNLTMLLSPAFWVSLVAAVGLGFAAGYHNARDHWKSKYDRVVEQVGVERKAWAGKIAALDSQFTNVGLSVKDSYEQALVETTGRLNAVINRLRREREAKPLKPAEGAPTACREYEAPPSQLSDAHRELLVRLGAEADQVVVERNACFTQYEAVRKAFNEFNEREEQDGR